MNPHTTTQLAAARRDDLIADATRYRHYRYYRRSSPRSRGAAARGRRIHRGISALNALIDASQL